VIALIAYIQRLGTDIRIDRGVTAAAGEKQ